MMFEVSYIINHKSSHGTADLIVGFGFAIRSQQNKQKPETETHPPESFPIFLKMS